MKIRASRRAVRLTSGEVSNDDDAGTSVAAEVIALGRSRRSVRFGDGRSASASAARVRRARNAVGVIDNSAALWKGSPESDQRGETEGGFERRGAVAIPARAFRLCERRPPARRSPSRSRPSLQGSSRDTREKIFETIPISSVRHPERQGCDVERQG